LTRQQNEAREKTERAARIVSEVQQALLQPHDIHEIYALVSEKVQTLIGDCVTGVSLLNEDAQTVRGIAYAGLDIPIEKLFEVFGQNLMETAFPIAKLTPAELHIYRNGKLERLEDGLSTLLSSLVPRPLCVAVEQLLRVRDIYAMGFIHGSERLGAVIILARDEIAPYRNTIEQIVHLASFAINRLRAETALHEMATTDPLTQLFNRRYFFSMAEIMLAQARRYRHPLSVITLDIDRFKSINDTYGHAVGDETLKVLANIIRGSFRISDIAARFGGDEFVIMLPETNAHQAVHIAERLRNSILQTAVTVGEHQLFITLSIGVASTSETEEPAQIDVLLDYADRALYKAKQQGRNQVQMSTSENATG
jgi:diguanylate cyclase (GGDEF)-like protein